MTERKGSLRSVRGKFYTRPRLGKGRRLESVLIALDDEGVAQERADRIAAMAERLVEAGRWFDVEQLARAMGAAKTEREVRIIETVAERAAASGPSLGQGDETFEGLASRWTSGALHRAYPDHVKKKNPKSDIGILSKYVNPLVGHIPVRAFTREHGDSVMRSLPTTIGTARRRHVAQVIHRVLAIAAFPVGIIEHSPLPKGWLPKLGKGKALTYLYPDEDRTMLGCTDLPVDRRLLFGFLVREGMRLSEALATEWSDLDLTRGAVNLDENKTDDPRAWALDPSVAEAFRWWKGVVGGEGPFRHMSARHMADQLRADLRVAGITREALYKLTEKRRPLRAHDLRATFVTIALATGKTEAWVQDRTGHRSTLMIAKYRRAARTVAELGLGALTSIAEAIPEVRGGDQVGIAGGGGTDKLHASSTWKNKVGSPSRIRTETPFRARDFKAAALKPKGHKPRRKQGPEAPSHPLRGGDPQGDPHPTQERPTWRDLADSFDGFVAEEAGVRRPRRKG